MLELSGPIIASLEITDKCSYGNCPNCPKGFESTGGEPLSVTGWEKVINTLDEYVQEYRVTGGEPVEHPHFFDILAVLEKTNKFYHIFTNGMWKNTDEILEGLMKCAHVNTITFSLHGHDAKTHNAFTGGEGEESFDLLLENLKMAYAAGHNVNTNTVLTKKNIEHIEDIANLAMDLGARYSIFSRYIGPEREDISITSDELKKACEKVQELESLGFNVMTGNCIPHCHFPSSSSGCFAGITYATIDPHGNMRPCDHSKVVAGNISSDNIKKVWRSDVMKKWRERIPKICRKCSKISVCPGGCKVVVDLTGKPMDPLIGQPVNKPERPPVLEVTLEEDLCPTARYITRTEDFGWVLIRGTQVIPVNRRAEKILKLLDGKTTLKMIHKKAGDGALSFIYSLYVRNFIEFRTLSEDEV
ncbi:MAG: radical SAM protein [Candidatus Eremiobacteraeota bacterium]|nr:radical SAM protein [Candidatus Eremiobacteraeota bacterium]